MTATGEKRFTVTASFKRDFDLVMEAFKVLLQEIEEAKAIARANMVAAEDAYYADAAMIRAGWIPTQEQVAEFLKRTGFVVEPRWPVEQRAHVEVRWPSLNLKAAA